MEASRDTNATRKFQEVRSQNSIFLVGSRREFITLRSYCFWSINNIGLDQKKTPQVKMEALDPPKMLLDTENVL